MAARVDRKWIRYMFAGLVGFLASRLGDNAAGWLNGVTEAILGY